MCARSRRTGSRTDRGLGAHDRTPTLEPSEHTVSVRTAILRAPLGPRAARRLLAAVLVALAAMAATVGIRAGLQHLSSPAATVRAGAFPTSPAIEQRWGVRFTAVNILADGGILEIRYIVLDDGKTGRMHSGKAMDLPVIHSEASGTDVKGNSVIFHLHTDNSSSQAGHDFSILYGNANGAVRPGSSVAIVLPDGLRLEHVPVPR